MSNIPPSGFAAARTNEGGEKARGVCRRSQQVSGLPQARELTRWDERHFLVAPTMDNSHVSGVFHLIPDFCQVLARMAITDADGHNSLYADLDRKVVQVQLWSQGGGQPSLSLFRAPAPVRLRLSALQ
jgi:hypothetical protein